MTTRHRLDIHSMEALARLADALDTTTEELLLHAPDSWFSGSEAAELVPLGEPECRRLIETGEIGRIAYGTPSGPAILPVTYGMAAGRPVFRTAPGSPLALLGGQRVAFEIDRVDHVRREGWSVVVTGSARVVLGATVNPPDGHAVVEPWPGGGRDVYVVLDPDRITGRRVQQVARP